MQKDVRNFVFIALIAGIYTAISLLLAPFSFGNIQIRIAEALTVFPLIYKSSIWGVSLGCFLTNLIGALMGANPTGLLDSVIGTSATLLAALLTYKLRNIRFKDLPLLSLLMPIIFNFFFIGLELASLFMPDKLLLGFLIMGSEVALGETIAVIIGYLLVITFKKKKLLMK